MNSEQLKEFLSIRDKVIDFLYEHREATERSEILRIAKCLDAFKIDVITLSNNITFKSAEDLVSVYDYYFYIYQKNIINADELIEKMLYGIKYKEKVINYAEIIDRIYAILDFDEDINCPKCNKDQYDCTCFEQDDQSNCHICEGICECGRLMYLKRKHLGPYSKL